MTINITSPTGNITKIEVYNGETLITEALSDFTSLISNESYRLLLSETRYSDLFEDGVINATLKVKVYDESTVEGEYEDTTLIGEQSITISCDTKEPELVFKGINDLSDTIITTINEENKLYFSSSREIKNIRYIFERYRNTSTITANNFDSSYASCELDNKRCAAGALVTEENGMYVIKLVNRNNLISDEYRLIIYAEDSDGHIITKELVRDIKVDNSNPIITIESDISLEDEEYKIYNNAITVNVTDKYNSSNGPIYYNSTIKQITITKLGETSVSKTFAGVTQTTNIKIGGLVNEFKDGYYEIIVEDYVGLKTVEKVLVDTVNDGFNLNNSDTTFSKPDLEDLEITFNEDMELFIIRFYISNNSNVSVTVDKNGDYQLCETNSKCNEVKENSYFRINKGDKIGINELLKYNNSGHNVDKLDKSINKMEIIVYNRSNIKNIVNNYILDFNAPVITAKEGARYSSNGERVTAISETLVLDSGYICGKNDISCYSLNVPVIVDKDEAGLADSLSSIVKLFIRNIDGLSYDSARTTDRLMISMYTRNMENNIDVLYGAFNANSENWEPYNILDVVGEYIVKFEYTDEAGNESKPVYLVLNVRDEINPTVSLVNTSVKNKFYLKIEDIEGISYVDEGVIGQDNYGFIVDGQLVKETTNYELTYLYNDEEFTFVEGVLNIGGTKYVTVENNIYTFYKAGLYTFIYKVIDSTNRSVTKTINIDVLDKNAPVITDGNAIDIKVENDVKLFEIGNIVYKIEEEDGIIVRVTFNDEKDSIEVSDNRFVLNGIKYLIEQEYVLINGLNVDNSTVCFYQNDECQVFVPLEAFDYEDNIAKTVILEKVEYSRNGRYSTPDYTIEENAENTLFGIKSVKFNDVGVYKLTFYTVDSNNNVRKVTYEMEIFDIRAPEFIVGGKTYQNGETTDDVIVEYTRQFGVDLSKYQGTTEEQKLDNWFKTYIKSGNGNIIAEDNYDGELSYTLGEVIKLDTNKYKKEYVRYSVVVSAKDSSNNTSSVTVVVSLKDLLAPTNGEIEMSYDSSMKDLIAIGTEMIYTNQNSLYFRVINGSDNTSSFRYEYQIVYDNFGYRDDNFETLDGIGEYIAIINETESLRIYYRVVDEVGNYSEVKVTQEFTFDKVSPVIRGQIKEKLENETILTDMINQTVYKGENTIRIIFRDDSGSYKVRGYKNNRLVTNMSITDERYIEVKGFGNYRYIVTDKAGNETIFEFVILPSDNQYTVIDNTQLGNVENATSVQMTFDEVVLQKLKTDKKGFYFEDVDTINNNDIVHFMGIVPNKDIEEVGTIFSIYTSGGVKGQVFKQSQLDRGYFALDIYANITGIDEDYTVDDYLINFKGDVYILVGIVRNGVEEDTSNNEGNTGNKGTKGSDFTWLLYALGIGGALGGGFLIMRLRKRVRAA